MIGTSHHFVPNSQILGFISFDGAYRLVVMVGFISFWISEILDFVQRRVLKEHNVP
jgi:uncharacterized membrane protein